VGVAVGVASGVGVIFGVGSEVGVVEGVASGVGVIVGLAVCGFGGRGRLRTDGRGGSASSRFGSGGRFLI